MRAALGALRQALLLPAAVGIAIGLAPVTGQAQILSDAVRSRLATWYRSAARSAPGGWGIAIGNQMGEILWSVKPDEPMIPASTVKLLTTGFARTVLGGDARLATRVAGTGHVDPESGEWVGSWSLQLNGDPSLERANRGGPT
ncbi:MAG: D-alanyl-D-alanine carboxypeptidase, partial [Gemmatimonadales bacterium]